MYESLVANEYLVEVFPPGGEYNTPPLLPSSPAEKAQSRIIAARCNDLVTAYFGYLSNKNEVRPTKTWRHEKSTILKLEGALVLFACLRVFLKFQGVFPL